MTRYPLLRPEEIRPATYLPGMDPDDPPLTDAQIAKLRRRQRRERDMPMIALAGVGVLALVTLALIAMAAGWS